MSPNNFANTFSRTVTRLFSIALVGLTCMSQMAVAQQTLGSIAGTVTDSSGAVVPKVAVTIRNVATNFTATAQTADGGFFNSADLPIGTYEVTFSRTGFQTAVHPQILVQGNRTTTVNARLQPGTVTSTVTVSDTPLLNETDTTRGYVLNSRIIANTPLGTGSFTQLAILSPGVNADLLNTAGTNAGFGNQSIWANGQRDSSNSFSFNGVNANNVFKWKVLEPAHLRPRRCKRRGGRQQPDRRDSDEHISVRRNRASPADTPTGNDPGIACQLGDVRCVPRRQQRCPY